MIKLTITCPKCSAKGVLEVNSLTTLVIGPCPSCNELLLEFCGKVIKLDSTIVFDGEREEVRDHLMVQMMEALEPSIDELLVQLRGPEKKESIPAREIDKFKTELSLLDNGDYFKAIFGS